MRYSSTKCYIGTHYCKYVCNVKLDEFFKEYHDRNATEVEIKYFNDIGTRVVLKKELKKFFLFIVRFEIFKREHSTT